MKALITCTMQIATWGSTECGVQTSSVQTWPVKGIQFFKNSTILNILISHYAPAQTDYSLDKISAELPDGIELAFDSIIIKI